MNKLNTPNIVAVLTCLLFVFRFVNVIFNELWEGHAAEIKAAHFLCVLSDLSTDVSGRDLEEVFVRILSSGLAMAWSCGSHGLELAAMDAMKKHERMRKARNSLFLVVN